MRVSMLRSNNKLPATYTQAPVDVAIIVENSN